MPQRALATIGDGSEEARLTLRRFLAQLAGVNEAQVHVVQGRREDIVLPPMAENPLLGSLDPKEVVAKGLRFMLFGGHSVVDWASERGGGLLKHMSAATSYLISTGI